MTQLLLSMAFVCLASSPAGDALQVSARIEAEALEVGQEYDVVLEVGMEDGWSASNSGVPNALLQIQVPPSVELSGEVLKTHRELSRNEFLQAPFERLIEEKTTRIQFKLRQKPSKKERIRFNILAYTSSSGDDDHWFVRQRYSLKLKPGAKAKRSRKAKALRSDWGQQNELTLGEKIKPIGLPRADGSMVYLRKYLGKKNIIVTTYRAFW